MRVITIKRPGKRARTSKTRRSVLRFARDFFAGENHWEFTIEALFFGALLAISAWPIVVAANAINTLL